MSTRLKLDREWTLGDLIGGGGFGQVYAAISSDGETAVAKMVPKAPGAERELLFVDLSGVHNVVPIIDSGETVDNWVLIMPRAEKSLRQHLDEIDGPLDVPEVATILMDITTALADLAGKIVHRDLKPENVLFLGGVWCLADFGISRYAEATTAPDTQKYAMSLPYAAPERWRNERATTATDVYSLGVIAFEILSNSRPFLGPEIHDYRDQHLHNDPPSPSAPSAMVALVMECMYKAAEARPSPANILARLESIGNSHQTGGLAQLQEANREEVDRRSEAERRASQERSETERRGELLDAGIASWRLIANELRAMIVAAAPSATVSEARLGGWDIRLNQAEFEFVGPAATAQDPWGTQDSPMFDVVAHAKLGIKVPPDAYGYCGRSHSIWFCDAQEAGQYRWFETAFMFSPSARRSSQINPFALDPAAESAIALRAAVNEYQAAWPFTPLNAGELDEFVDRWAGWFAAAAQRTLSHPSSMPEHSPNGSWRRS